MDRWIPAVVVVLAIAFPIPLFITPAPADVDASLDRIEWTAPILDERPIGDVVYVVDISTLSDRDKLTYISLQGLVNADVAEVYVIYADKDAFWLSRLEETQGVDLERIEPEQFARRYSDVPRGMVIIDPDRDETINVATTIAGVEEMIIVHPSRADAMRDLMGDLPVIDLRESPWSDLEGMDLHRKAFDRYFTRCHQRFIGFMPPGNLYARDIMISHGAFVFYQVPGPFSNPAEWEKAKVILGSTPHIHAILGAVEPYIGAEEDFAIRDFSIHGKYFVPCARVPNLSLLSNFEGAEEVDIGVSEPDVELERKHYVTIGMEDGDNLAFLHDRMVDHWLQPERGSVPVAWTIPPYVRDMAPVYMDFYLSDMSENDTFIMAPSGAGLAFPDFFSDGVLDRFMELTTLQVGEMNASFIWALNSYRTYEVKWSDDLLDRYARTGIRGLLMDYDDMPWHYQYEIVGDAERNIPVIRSTQLWHDSDNLKAKLEVAIDAYDERPYFTFLAFNPWAADIGELLEILGDFDVEIVDMATFFALMEAAVPEDARHAIDTLKDIPTSALMPHLVEGAEDSLEDAEDGDEVNTYRAWRARNRAESGIGLALVLLICMVGFSAAFLIAMFTYGRREGPPWGTPVARVLAMTLILTAFLVLYYRIQFSETWNYFPLAIAALAMPIISIFTIKRERRTMLWAGSTLFLAGLAVCYLTLWGFMAFAVGAFMLVWWTSDGHMDEMIVALSLALGLALVLPREIGTAMAIGMLTPAALYLLSGLDTGERFKGSSAGVGSGFAALVVLGAVFHDSRYLVQRFDYFPGALTALSPWLPVVGCAVGYMVMKTPARRVALPTGILIFGASWVLVPIVDNLSALALLLLAQQIGLVMAALSAATSGKRTPTPMFPAMTLGFLILYNMMIYTTPVIVDVYILGLNYTMNYVLYHHALFLMLISAMLFIMVFVEFYVMDRALARIGGFFVRDDAPAGGPVPRGRRSMTDQK